MKKKINFLIIATVLLVFCTEIFLRDYYGFCDAILIKEDANFEYIPQPNQHRFRFRNHVNYNSLSMRSEEIDSTSHIILGFGDSFINGGVLVDQDSLATSILSKTLSNNQGKKVQFLNISAGSWGPDNGYSYLEQYGNFGAKSIFLFVSSHDAYDNMDFQKIVGVNKSFPAKQYSWALYELFDRYLIPMVESNLTLNAAEIGNLVIDKKKEGKVFNTGFMSFLSYTNIHNIPLTIYLHSDMEEVQSGSYNKQGKEIIRFAKEKNIPIILDLENGLNASHFRDNIHLNSKGQRKLAEIIVNKWNF
jgi:hypothetical protein